MTEAEYLEIMEMVYVNIPDASMNFTACVFAYIAAAYFAGAKLPRLIAVGTSIVYTLYLLGPFLGVFLGSLRWLKVCNAYQNDFPNTVLNTPISNPELMVTITCSPLIIGWVASLLFMHLYVRKGKAKYELIQAEH